MRREVSLVVDWESGVLDSCVRIWVSIPFMLAVFLDERERVATGSSHNSLMDGTCSGSGGATGGL